MDTRKEPQRATAGRPGHSLCAVLAAMGLVPRRRMMAAMAQVARAKARASSPACLAIARRHGQPSSPSPIGIGVSPAGRKA